MTSGRLVEIKVSNRHHCANFNFVHINGICQLQQFIFPDYCKVRHLYLQMCAEQKQSNKTYITNSKIESPMCVHACACVCIYAFKFIIDQKMSVDRIGSRPSYNVTEDPEDWEHTLSSHTMVPPLAPPPPPPPPNHTHTSRKVSARIYVYRTNTTNSIIKI